MPAADILNIAMNEGSAAKDQDFSLCFAASGDLRNVIKTVNGLPQDYSGHLKLVINDLHPQVAIRNVVLLCMLLDPSGPSEEFTAEVVLHTLYSARLTPSQASFVQSWVDRIDSMDPDSEGIFNGQMEFGPRCDLGWLYPRDVASLLKLIKKPSYTTSQAEANRLGVMLSPQRIDYRERYIWTQRPRHRLGYTYWRKTGLLLPIGQPLDSFDTVNRLLYSEDGEWLLKDNASPATAWDPLEVDKTRQRSKLPEEDYMGNLFFHIKHQLVEFIKRVRSFKLKVFLFSIDLLVLPEFLNLLGKETRQIKFDRVETSNVMDTLGPSPILASWGPRLNRDNPHSCLLMYSMNWAMKIPGGHVESLGRDKVQKTMMQVATYLGFKKGMKVDKPPPMGQLTTNLGAFFDTRPGFSRYLRENGVQEACQAFGVRERKVPRILPPRIGVGIKDFDSPKITITLEQWYWIGCIQYPTWHERFLEFEAS
ncbi:hypothetical protein M407DRAFT_22966 [Tulasnella calospora MUT 4182]|uniref:DUF4470 domain-containing protein n=1 Tax=Tulasnella calospora MUT 4182 TaxID=1051891 RepID=A0A0C3M272_9AGAM|nr:hypothetical protein M407DRAFT_22966 [Tulasnella calospora MUT 4182]